MTMGRRLRAASLVCALALGLAAGPARADDMAGEGGMGVAAALASLIYGPVKVVYAASGLVFGGIAWALSGGDSAVMQAVITPAVRGDYVITPDVLRRERPLEFFGRDPAYREQVANGRRDRDLVAEVY